MVEINWGWAFVYMLGALVLLIAWAIKRAISSEKEPELSRDEFDSIYRGRIVALIGLTHCEYNEASDRLWEVYLVSGEQGMDEYITNIANQWREHE